MVEVESLDTRFSTAPDFNQYLESVEKNADLWQAVYRRASVAAEAVEAVAQIPGTWHLVALAADWCGDAVNILPVIARLAEAAPNVDLKIIERDDNLDIMDAHLTNGRSRSIPVVIAYDEHYVERGWWGPRPTELQTWVMETGLEMEADDRYREARKWYARDKGKTVVREISALLADAAGS